MPVPKSKMRDQVVFAAGLTQVEIVQSPVQRVVTLLGSVTYSPVPLSLTALPSLPATRGPVAGRRAVADRAVGPQVR